MRCVFLLLFTGVQNDDLVLWHLPKGFNAVFFLSFENFKTILVSCLFNMFEVYQFIAVSIPSAAQFVPSLESKNLFTFTTESFRYVSTLTNSLIFLPQY